MDNKGGLFMKKLFKKTTAILLTLLIIITTFSAIPFTVSAAEVTDDSVSAVSGTTGDCTWELNENGTLTISGNGAMDSYIPRYPAPWSNYEFNKVVIEYGVTSIGNHAFSNSKMTNITIPNSVKSIGKFAFLSCTNLKDIIVPDGITSIEEGVFYDCKIVESIDLPDTITNIDYCAFKGCTKLESITIPESVTEIGNMVFDGCSNLTIYGNPSTYAETYANINNNPFVALKEIIASGTTGDCTWTIDDDGTLIISGNGVIEDNAFSINLWREYNINEVIIEDGVTKIGSDAFYECRTITSVSIPESVTSIGLCAFSGTGLTSIILPDSVTNIEYGVFCGTGLTSIIIPDSVTNIEGDAFSGTGLTSITIPDSVTSIGVGAFRGCNKLSSIIVDENNMKYDSRNNCNAIIETESNCLIQGCSNTVIPDSVKRINESAFEQTILTNITIPNSVRSIGSYAFSTCTSLKSITIPESVTSIGRWAFYECTSLTSITIPESVISIGDFAFFNCTSLTSITIPESVISIGDCPFQWCTSLTGITVDERNAIYDSRNNCNAIIETGKETLIQGCANTVIPNSVEFIGKYAFNRCENLTSITIPDSVISIGCGAFSECTSLTSITIPDSVTSIDCWAFDNTTWYDSQPDGIVYAGKVAYGYKGTMPENTSLTLKEGTVGIAEEAFYGFTNLTEIIIPEGVEVIGKEAFWGCSGLTSIVIPSSVIRIGDLAFCCCVNLETIDIPDSVINIGFVAFVNTKWYKEQSDGVVYAGSAAYDYKVGSTTPEPDVITLKSGTKSITQGAFFGCNIESIIIPNTVTKIGSYAFANCNSLKSVTIPPSVKSIGEKAFGYYLDNGTINDFLNFDEMEFGILKFQDNDNNGIEIQGTKNSAAEKYANSEQEFTFKESDIYDYTFSWGTDNWGFNNTKDSVKGASIDKDTVKKLAEIFHIENINDLNTLETKLNNISKNDWTFWPGSCFGMTVAEILVKQGLLSLSDYGVGNISNALPTDKNKLITLISVLSELQNCGYYATARRSIALSTENSSSTTDEGSQNSGTTSITQKNFIKKIEEELKTVENEEEAKKNHSVILIEYAYKNPNNNIKHHTVLGYGIESGEYEYNGKTYEHRILIADPNKLSQNGLYDNACIYYHYKDDEDNEDYDRWICPYQNDNNGKCYYNGNESDPGQIKLLIKYNSLTDPEFYPEVSKDYYIAGLTIFNDIENLTVGEGITDYPISDQLDDRKLYAFDNTKECSFSYTTPSDYSMMVDYENISYYAKVEKGTSTLVKPEGYINIEGSNATYSITMMTNNSKDESDWYSITVSGSNTNNVTLSKQENGDYLLETDSSEDSLGYITITAKKNSGKITVAYNTQSSSAIIKKDENNIAVMVNSNEDGDYDKKLSPMGDVNGNGVVDINDVTAIQYHLAELEPIRDNQLAFADVNGNGAFDINDATQLQKNLAGLTG